MSPPLSPSGAPSRRPLNIVLLIDGLRGGGAEKVVLTLAGEMARQGHETTIVSLDHAQEYPLPEAVSLLVVEDSYRGPLRRQTETWRRARQLEQALTARFGDRPIDLAISNLPHCDRIVAACPRLRHAWHCLHNALIAGQLAHRRGWRRWLKIMRLRRLYRSRRLITVSDGIQQDIHACGIRPAAMQTIHNPFDLDAIRQCAQTPCPLGEQRFILHVGRLHRQKRHDRLLAAFRQSGYPGMLVLLGQGTPEQTQAIRRQAEALGIAERVIMPGFADNPFSWMRAAEALVLSSDYEGFGNVIVEALACGTPVVSTRCPHGPDEILSGELARGLCEPDINALAITLKRVLARPPRIETAHLAPFELQRIVARYLALAAPVACTNDNAPDAAGAQWNQPQNARPAPI